MSDLVAYGRRITALEREITQHIGQDWGSAGYEYPHPSAAFKTLTFGVGSANNKGLGRLDSTGIQFISDITNLAAAALYIVPDQYSDSPASVLARASLTGQVSASSTGTALRLALESAANIYSRLDASYNSVTPSYNLALSQDVVGTIYGFEFYQDNIVGPYWRFIQGVLAPLLLPTMASDPAASSLANGDIWYRSDLFTYRGRANGVTITFALSSDLALYIPLSTVTTKGDLIAATGNAAVSRLAIGTDGQSLVADSTQATGIKWADASSAWVQVPL